MIKKIWQIHTNPCWLLNNIWDPISPRPTLQKHREGAHWGRRVKALPTKPDNWVQSVQLIGWRKRTDTWYLHAVLWHMPSPSTHKHAWCKQRSVKDNFQVPINVSCCLITMVIFKQDYLLLLWIFSPLEIVTSVLKADDGTMIMTTHENSGVLIQGKSIINLSEI